MDRSCLEASPRTLLLIPSIIRTAQQIDRADDSPTMDYRALQVRLSAEIADYASADADNHPLVRLARGLGRDAALAAHGFLRRRDFDVIYSNGENVGIPLGALLGGVRSRPGHVLIGHRLSPPKKRALLRAVQGAMDVVFVYAATQHEYGIRVLGWPREKLRLIPFHADHRFWKPTGQPIRRMVCSAGLEWRDYPTLVDAASPIPGLEVRLGAASPWSKHRNETRGRALPANVTAQRYTYAELRDLYASASCVVVPLYDNDFQAGVTTILEGMAVGRPVIATRTAGQRDVIRDGVNGLYVAPGDPDALRAAIVAVLEDPSRAAALGAAARRTIEEQMTLDHWVESLTDAIMLVAAQRRSATR